MPTDAGRVSPSLTRVSTTSVVPPVATETHPKGTLKRKLQEELSALLSCVDNSSGLSEGAHLELCNVAKRVFDAANAVSDSARDGVDDSGSDAESDASDDFNATFDDKPLRRRSMIATMYGALSVRAEARDMPELVQQLCIELASMTPVMGKTFVVPFVNELRKEMVNTHGHPLLLQKTTTAISRSEGVAIDALVPHTSISCMRFAQDLLMMETLRLMWGERPSLFDVCITKWVKDRIEGASDPDGDDEWGSIWQLCEGFGRRDEREEPTAQTTAEPAGAPAAADVSDTAAEPDAGGGADPSHGDYWLEPVPDGDVQWPSARAAGMARSFVLFLESTAFELCDFVVDGEEAVAESCIPYSRRHARAPRIVLHLVEGRDALSSAVHDAIGTMTCCIDPEEAEEEEEEEEEEEDKEVAVEETVAEAEEAAPVNAS